MKSRSPDEVGSRVVEHDHPFRLLLVGVERGAAARWEDSLPVAGVTEQLTKLLLPFGPLVERAKPFATTTAAEAKAALSDWFYSPASADSSSSERPPNTLLYWIGHGSFEDRALRRHGLCSF
jgi:hypothetical protein